MYYEFLVTHLDAPFLLLAAVTTGLIIRVFYHAYMKLKLAMRVLTSVILFIINAIMIVPGVVFLYRWIMLCGFYQPSGAFDRSEERRRRRAGSIVMRATSRGQSIALEATSAPA